MRLFEHKHWLMALAAFSLAGCATSSLDLAPPAPDQPWQPKTDAAGDIVPGATQGETQDAAQNAAQKGYALPPSKTLSSLPDAPATLQAGHAYTLPELIDLAESANPNTRIAWNTARNAALATGIARSAYLPQLTAVAMGGYESSHGSSPTLLGNLGTDTTGSGSVAALSLQWLLFDFGIHASVKAAEQATIAANLGFTATHQQVIHDVTVAYYAYEAARARSRTAVTGQANADGILAAAKARFKQGVGTVIEVAQATQNQAQANLIRVQADGLESDAYLNLVSALGISPMSRLTVAAMPERTLSPALIKPVDQIVADAISRRPDVRSAYALAQASAAKVDVARSAFLPKVFVAGTAAYATGRAGITLIPPIGDLTATVNPSGSQYNDSVFLGVTMPLYDGGRRAAMLKQAHDDADSATLRLTRTQEEAVREIVGAQNALRTSLASQAAAKALVAASQTTYDAAFAAYKHGVGSITDTLRAQNQLLAAQNACTDSASTSLSAAATLALATGMMGGDRITETTINGTAGETNP